MYLVAQLSSGGQERQLFNLLQELDKVRYKPVVAVWNFNEHDFYVSKIEDLGVTIYPLPVGASSVIKLAKLYDLVRTLHAEVVHSYSFYTNCAVWSVTLNGRAVPVGSIRSSFFRARASAGWAIGVSGARWPRHQICNSYSAAEEARKASRLFSPHRVHVVVNGVNLERFYASPIPNRDATQIVAVGSLLPVKRWDRLLTAANALRTRGLGFHLKIAGRGPLHVSLARKISQLGLDEYVSLLGQREDVAKLIRESSFLAHTSEMEGCPNALIEAMSCARAVVSTDAGDVPSIVDNGVTGFVVERGDEQSLVERMAELITNPDLCERMGKAGREKAEHEFTLERLVEQTLAAYRAAGWCDS